MQHINTKEVVIRLAKLEEIDSLLRFEQAIIRAERPFDPTLKPDPISYYDLGQIITSPIGDVIVAQYRDRLVASGSVKIVEAKPYYRHDQYAHLGFMYVEPEFRGLGLNQRIINKALEWCKEKNITEVRLDVYSDNESAIKAYEKVGFNSHLITMRLDTNEK